VLTEIGTEASHDGENAADWWAQDTVDGRTTGDVVAVTTECHTTWLACERVGWRRIDTPANLTGQSLSASTVYEHPRRGHHV
jgi:hypothetical protein